MADYKLTTTADQERALQASLAVVNAGRAKTDPPQPPLTPEQFLQGELDRRFAIAIEEQRAQFLINLRNRIQSAPLDKLVAALDALEKDDAR